MRLYFGLTTLALALAAALKAPMAWDGSYQLFKILDTQAPFFVEHRFGVLPLQGLVLVASAVTDDVGLLQIVFGLAYVAVPLLALALSWWIVRGRAPSLFVFPALGIGLGTLPGQFFFASEALMAVQLFWPIILALLVGLDTPRGAWPVLLLLGAFVLTAHPVGAALLALGAALALLVAWQGPVARLPFVGLARLLALLALLRFVMIRSPYEIGALQGGTLRYLGHVSVSGRVLAALACAWAAGALLCLLAWNDTGLERARTALRALVVATLAASGVLLESWAIDPALWRNALGFRSFALLAGLPFIAMAAGESVLRWRHGEMWVRPNPADRVLAIRIVAAAFLMVLATQGMVWHRLTGTLKTALETSPARCLPTSALPRLGRTPLDHWSTPSYAILLQGRSPRTLVLADDGCAELRDGGAIPVAPWDRRARNTGWFDLSGAGR